jgi:hypothetical protein
MKNTLRICIGSAVLFLITLLIQNPASAQCVIKGTDVSTGADVAQEISCDFPLYIVTGDKQADDLTYMNSKDSWYSVHAADHEILQSTRDFTIIIQLADFQQMDAGRQQVILDNPQFFNVDGYIPKQ